MQISTFEADDDPVDALAVDLDNLQLWAVGDRLLRRRLAGVSVETAGELELRQGDLPPGLLGRRVLTGVSATVEALVASCEPERAHAPWAADVSVALDDGRRVDGTVGGIHGTSVLSVTYSSLGPKQRLEGWVRYLALTASTGETGYRAVSIGRQSGGWRRSTIGGIDPAEAQGILAELAALRDAGLRAPLPMALKTSEAYAGERRRGRDVATAVRRADSRWLGDKFPGERADREHVLVWGAETALADLMAAPPTGSEPLPAKTTRFGALACRLWTPLAEAETVTTS